MWGECFPPKMHACIISKMAFVREENNTIFHCLWSQCSRSVLNHIISLLGWIVDRANRLGLCVCVCVGGVGANLSAGLLSPPPLLYHPHIFSTQTHTTAVASQSLPLFLSIAVTCVTLHVLPWGSLMLPPHTLPLCLFQYEEEADLWLMMQAGCRRHHFPREEGLFLPLGTKYTKLPNIFMEPHLIPACQENISPHALHLSLYLSLHSSHWNAVPSKAYFYPLNWDDSPSEGFEKSCFSITAVLSVILYLSPKGDSTHILTLHREVRGQWSQSPKEHQPWELVEIQCFSRGHFSWAAACCARDR